MTTSSPINDINVLHSQNEAIYLCILWNVEKERDLYKEGYLNLVKVIKNRHEQIQQLHGQLKLPPVEPLTLDYVVPVETAGTLETLFKVNTAYHDKILKTAQQECDLFKTAFLSLRNQREKLDAAMAKLAQQTSPAAGDLDLAEKQKKIQDRMEREEIKGLMKDDTTRAAVFTNWVLMKCQQRNIPIQELLTESRRCKEIVHEVLKGYPTTTETRIFTFIQHKINEVITAPHAAYEAAKPKKKDEQRNKLVPSVDTREKVNKLAELTYVEFKRFLTQLYNNTGSSAYNRAFPFLAGNLSSLEERLSDICDLYRKLKPSDPEEKKQIKEHIEKAQGYRATAQAVRESYFQLLQKCVTLPQVAGSATEK